VSVRRSATLARPAGTGVSGGFGLTARPSPDGLRNSAALPALPEQSDLDDTWTSVTAWKELFCHRA
jgi:hypothetical protein